MTEPSRTFPFQYEGHDVRNSVDVGELFWTSRPKQMPNLHTRQPQALCKWMEEAFIFPKFHSWQQQTPKSAQNRLPNAIKTPHLKHINSIYRTQCVTWISLCGRNMNYNRTVMLLVSLSDLLLLLDFLVISHWTNTTKTKAPALLIILKLWFTSLYLRKGCLTWWACSWRGHLIMDDMTSMLRPAFERSDCSPTVSNDSLLSRCEFELTPVGAI